MLSFNRLVLSLSVLCIVAGVLLYNPPLFNLQGKGEAVAVSRNMPSPPESRLSLSLALQLDRLNCDAAKKVMNDAAAGLAKAQQA